MSATDPGALTTEGRNPRTTALDTMSALEIVRAMNAEDATVAIAVGQEAVSISAAVAGIVARFAQGGRLIYVGAGTSGRLGVLDASECPPTFNTPPGLVVGVIAGGRRALTESVEAAEDNPDAGAADIVALDIKAADAVVGIAASGRTPYVLGAVAEARRRGAFTVGVACNAGTALAAAVEVAIEVVVGPEVVSGSTRLKVGTAQKMVLNMLSTGAFVLSGKTYGNLMVDVRATNEKLRRRAVHIVREATGLNAHDATAVLAGAGGEIKTAIVVALAGVSPEEARARIARHGGRVRAALALERDA